MNLLFGQVYLQIICILVNSLHPYISLHILPTVL